MRVPFVFDVSGTRRIDSMAVADVEPGDQAEDWGGLATAAADAGGSVLIPGYDLVRCNIVENYEWTDGA